MRLIEVAAFSSDLGVGKQTEACICPLPPVTCHPLISFLQSAKAVAEKEVRVVAVFLP